jgi:hypothetical protein
MRSYPLPTSASITSYRYFGEERSSKIGGSRLRKEAGCLINALSFSHHHQTQSSAAVEERCKAILKQANALVESMALDFSTQMLLIPKKVGGHR